MILPALIDYYQRLEADPGENVAPLGYSQQKIGFCVVLGPQGQLRQIQDTRINRNGRLVPLPMIIPGQSKPSGSGINPCFLWDNTQYMLGFAVEDNKPTRTAQAFEAFRKRHLDLEDQINDEGFIAVCRFLKQWNPADAVQYPILAEITGGFGVFKLEAQPQYIHERSAIKAWWDRQLNRIDTNEVVGESLVTGRSAALARLHEPRIKGVIGAQTSGATLVSYNSDAFTSYGKEQSFNAPVAVDEAFRYATALNRLLADNAHRTRIGDTTVVFWSQSPTPFEDEFGWVTSDSAEDPAVREKIRAFFAQLRQGLRSDQPNDASVPFYVLGLSPNAARLSVRFWLTGSVGQFAERLGRHVQDLEMIGGRPDDPPLTIRRLLLETARPKGGKPDADSISPLLAGEVTRAILDGGPYPQTLFMAVIRRIRADGNVNHRRAAILKACLIRRIRPAGQNKEIPVSLNKDHPEPAYHMGRLLAVLEKVQEEALGGNLNSTIKDRYFSSASATPAGVFPRLMRLHQHHLNKVDNPGLRVNREKLVQEICDHLTEFPSHLPLAGQGLFCIAYYQQRQDLFTKRAKEESSSEMSATQETES